MQLKTITTMVLMSYIYVVLAPVCMAALLSHTDVGGRGSILVPPRQPDNTHGINVHTSTWQLQLPDHVDDSTAAATCRWQLHLSITYHYIADLMCGAQTLGSMPPEIKLLQFIPWMQWWRQCDLPILWQIHDVLLILWQKQDVLLILWQKQDVLPILWQKQGMPIMEMMMLDLKVSTQHDLMLAPWERTEYLTRSSRSLDQRVHDTTQLGGDIFEQQLDAHFKYPVLVPWDCKEHLFRSSRTPPVGDNLKQQSGEPNCDDKRNVNGLTCDPIYM